MLFGRSKAVLANDHPFSNCPFLLISGMGRSGTTVLRNCINEHSDVLCRNLESNYIYHLMRGANLHMEKKFGRKNLGLTASQFWALHRQFILSLLWPTEPGASETAPKAIATYSMLDPRAAIGLSETFPQLSICLIVRNGIEVVSSYRAFEHFKHISFEEVCRTWQFNSSIVHYVTGQPHCTLVRFEWIQEDLPQFVSALTKALKQIDLKFDQACLTPLNSKYHPTTLAGESREDGRDLAKRRDRWKLWSDKERDLFAEICGETMESLGYPIPWR